MWHLQFLGLLADLLKVTGVHVASQPSLHRDFQTISQVAFYSHFHLNLY